ncbi:glycerophosphocholine choline phosphodiesterase ENPP6-like [Oppia nitens]|uniref:glycerophosphocholine choline phosphodiesterase ENPP6-like n=1 Tax=Oppia nitens TaxID=1686743 RepID=UPI0023D99AC8|nr:glycerophosphocholine choline phosphodiesterase ENPP6-like [Oppia nitens]
MFLKLLCLCVFSTYTALSLHLNYENIETNNNESNENSQKLLIILVDGFRWDYATRASKGFSTIARNGVKAPYVTPIYPANSYPNWASIVTGRYAENHGFLQNYIYDAERHDIFLMTPNVNASHEHWWNQSEPIWTTAEKNHVSTAMYLWDGCQVPIDGIKPNYCLGYHAVSEDMETANNETRAHLKTILDNFANNKHRLALLYHEYVDHIGHSWGPDTSNVTDAVIGIDKILQELYDELKSRKLDNEVNVVIVSDHGMAQEDGFKKIHLQQYIDFNDVEIFLGGWSGGQLTAKPGKEDTIVNELNKLEGIKVYKRDDIPDEFHYKHNKNVLPILLTVEMGYEIAVPSSPGKVYPGGETHIAPDPPSGGNHGYDRHIKDMRGIMYAFGPALKNNYLSEPLEMVDHYNLFCHILGITPLPNNGTDSKVTKMLK